MSTPKRKGGSELIENYVIHLASQSERKTEFLARNGALADFQWSEGVLGSEANLQELVATGLLAPEMTSDGPISPGARLSRPAIGSALSHIALWKMAVAENRAITILENDAILAPEYTRTINELTEANPHFDIIQWGWNWDATFYARFLGNFGVVVCHFLQSEIVQNISTFQKLKIQRSLVELVHTWGIHCYTISPKGAAKLLESCLPLSANRVDRSEIGLSYFPSTLDGSMNQFYPNLEAFACWPPLSIVENDQARSSVGQARG